MSWIFEVECLEWIIMVWGMSPAALRFAMI